MRWFVLIGLALAACTDSSGFAGMYETTSLAAQDNGCGGTQVPEQILDDRWFKLDDVDGLVGYYQCSDAEHCDPIYDLTLSFGPAKQGGGWEGYFSVALPAEMCVLRYQVRRLSRGADGGIVIEQLQFEMTDGTLAGAACTADVASMRGATMPCVGESTQIAEPR